MKYFQSVPQCHNRHSGLLLQYHCMQVKATLSTHAPKKQTNATNFTCRSIPTSPEVLVVFFGMLSKSEVWICRPGLPDQLCRPPLFIIWPQLEGGFDGDFARISQRSICEIEINSTPGKRLKLTKIYSNSARLGLASELVINGRHCTEFE